MVCRRLGWLGVRLDEAANARTAGRIDTAESAVEVRIMSTDEELMLARHTRRLMPD
jgi:acetate kinase